MDPTTSRGFLNHNPGNIDRSEPPWNGEVRKAPDGGYVTTDGVPTDLENQVQFIELEHGRFCVFVNAEHGIRAMAKTLLAYRDRLGIASIRAAIWRWAPPNENNTDAYVTSVAHEVGVGPDDAVDLGHWPIMEAVIRSIISVECGGMPYQGTEIKVGMQLAGVTAPATA